MLWSCSSNKRATSRLFTANGARRTQFVKPQAGVLNQSQARRDTVQSKDAYEPLDDLKKPLACVKARRLKGEQSIGGKSQTGECLEMPAAIANLEAASAIIDYRERMRCGSP